MKKVAFLGAKKIGCACLKLLNEQKDALGIEIIAVLTNERGKEIADYCREQSLPVLASLDDYLALPEVDLAISVQYHAILRKAHLAKPKELTVNLHLAPLPEYRGCNQFSFAIVDGCREFGVTLHIMEAGIDDGDIISEIRFPVPEDCWVSELHQMAFEKALELFSREIGNVISSRFFLTPQADLIPLRGSSLHYRKEIETLKKLELGWPEEKILRHLRATYMPGFDPPYFELQGEKIYVVRAAEMRTA